MIKGGPFNHYASPQSIRGRLACPVLKFGGVGAVASVERDSSREDAFLHRGPGTWGPCDMGSVVEMTVVAALVG